RVLFGRLRLSDLRNPFLVQLLHTLRGACEGRQILLAVLRRRGRLRGWRLLLRLGRGRLCDREPQHQRGRDGRAVARARPAHAWRGVVVGVVCHELTPEGWWTDSARDGKLPCTAWTGTAAGRFRAVPPALFPP